MALSFHETMHGHLIDQAGQLHPVELQLKAETNQWQPFLRSGEMRITGVIQAPPWTDGAPFQGSLRLSLLMGRQIVYQLDFQDTEDSTITFYGQKDLSLRHPVQSAVTMRCQLSRVDAVIAPHELTFSQRNETVGDDPRPPTHRPLRKCKHAVRESVLPRGGRQAPRLVGIFGAGDRLWRRRKPPVGGNVGREGFTPRRFIIAQGEMLFDLNGLLHFVASWFPTAAIRSVDTGADAPLSPREQAIYKAFADTIIEPGQRVPPVDAYTMERAVAVVANMPAQVRLGLVAGLHSFDALARLRHGRSLETLDRPTRIALLQAPALQTAVHLVGMPVRIAHFDHPDFLAALGAPPDPLPPREPDPAWTQRIVTPEQLGSTEVVECDVVVIGTGAGGGPMAAALAERGLAVAIVEEGNFHGRKSFSGSPVSRMQRLWRDAGVTFSIGNAPVSLPMGKMVGGTTAINSGTCFRATEEVFADWRATLGLDLSESILDPYYQQVEQELQVTRAQAHLGVIAAVVAKGAEALGLPHGPLPRNAPDCDGQGTCILGCPSDAKRSSNVSWVPRAVRAGAALYTGLPVTRLLRHHRQIVAVEARGTDRFGAPKRLRIRARAVVLACGALITPHLLLENGFNLPWIGKNLSVHPEIGMWARVRGLADSWRAIPQGYGVDGVLGTKLEGYWVPPQLAGSTVPLFGAELTRWMDAYDQVVQFGFMVRDGGDGQVMRGLDGRPLIRYDLSTRSHTRLQAGAAVLAELLLRGGAEEVLTGIRGQASVRSVEEARAIASAPIRPADWSLLGSHPLGTCRIGATPASAVCGPDHRVFGTDNLYVVDGSSVPSSLGVNPQLTIMALSLRAAEQLAAKLSI